jgi:hypothetical protein
MDRESQLNRCLVDAAQRARFARRGTVGRNACGDRDFTAWFYRGNRRVDYGRTVGRRTSGSAAAAARTVICH